MQATLKDLSPRTHDSPSFAICQRVLHMCHEIIFGDPPAPNTSPYVTLNVPSLSRFSRRKVKHNAEPAIIGIGMVLAGAPALPQLTDIMGHVAIEQGRVEETVHQFISVEAQDEEIARGLTPSETQQVLQLGDEDPDEGSPNSDETHSPAPNLLLARVTSLPKLARHQVRAAQTVPALPLHLRSTQKSRASEDPLGQLDGDHVSIPYSSSPSISSARPSLRSATISRADALLETYDLQSQVHLLRSHYCHSEVRETPRSSQLEIHYLGIGKISPQFREHM